MFKASLFINILIILILNGCSVAEKQSIQSLKGDCENGKTSKCVQVAKEVLNTQRGKYADSTAVKYLSIACNAGDAKGCDFLGKMYYSENTITPNEEKSKTAFKKACDANYAIGCYHLGNIYNNAKEKDYNKSLNSLSKACDMDMFPACTRLGDMYFLGKGIAKNEVKAEFFYKKDKDKYKREQRKTLSKTSRYNDNSNTKKIFIQMRSQNFDALKTQHGGFISTTGIVSTGPINSVPDCVNKDYIYSLEHLVHSDKKKYKLFLKSDKYISMLWKIKLKNFQNTDFTEWKKANYTVKDKKIGALDVLNDWKMKKDSSTKDAPIEIRYKIGYWHKPMKDYEYHENVKDAKKVYVDFERFKEGRHCSELKFSCLPESKDTDLLDETLYDGLSAFELSKKKYDKLVSLRDINYDNYQDKEHPICEKPPKIWLEKSDEELIEKAWKKRDLVEVEKSIAKELPNFWEDTPKVVRYNWILKAMDVGEEFSYGKSKGMVDLCARVGINFYKDPKYKYIAGFVGIRTRNISYASDYIDFTIFDKRYDSRGNRYTHYLFGDSLRYLPRIKNQAVPSLNDKFLWVWE